MEAQERKLNWCEVAEIQLSYYPSVKASQRPKVVSSRQAYEVFLSRWDEGSIEFVEEFKVLLLTRGNRVLGITTLSTGGTAGTVVDIKLVYAAAIKANASSVILAHNHPSGQLCPSSEDIRMTRRLVEVGRLLDIPVLDHLIVTFEGFYSFADEGEL